MKLRFLGGSILLATLTLAGLGAAASRQSQVVCSEDVIPDNMAITATGTSPVCRGSCRARRIEPIRGAIMIICADQAVPKDYALDSVTTTPDCQCLGEEDNAYVIRKMGISEGQEEGETLATPTRTPMAFPTPTPWEPPPDFKTGE